VLENFNSEQIIHSARNEYIARHSSHSFLISLQVILFIALSIPAAALWRQSFSNEGDLLRWSFTCFYIRHAAPSAITKRMEEHAISVLRHFLLLLALVSAVGNIQGRGGGSAGSGTILPPPPPSITVSVTPGTETVLLGATVSFTASVTNSSDNSVSWSVNAISGGSAQVGLITADGVYAAPTDLPPGGTQSKDPSCLFFLAFSFLPFLSCLFFLAFSFLPFLSCLFFLAFSFLPFLSCFFFRLHELQPTRNLFFQSVHFFAI
jgi:hypothetical protein